MLAACYYVRRYETSHGKLVQNVCDHACGSVSPRPSTLCFNETALFIALTFCSLKNFVPFVYPCPVDHCVSSAVVVFFSLYSAQILVKPELCHVRVSREFYGEKNMKKKQVKYF